MSQLALSETARTLPANGFADIAVIDTRAATLVIPDAANDVTRPKRNRLLAQRSLRWVRRLSR
jgi:hypothetical protein